MFSIGFLTLDILILLIITAICFILSISKGKKILARAIMVFYPSTLLYLNLPYLKLNDALSKIISFIVIFTVFFILLKRNATAQKLSSGFRKTFDGIVLSIAVVILLLILYYHILPISNLYSITLPFSEFLTTKIPLGILILMPIIALVITNKKDE